ncbi:CHAT domain-containing protein [Rhizobiaceae bacterium n13]|uniref:CHAT domain-containing protein n=1 Tax=Ferirhizobium litorale TaxID=2927786 RepID=UPI0024B2D0F4|nr:CHAT domain-containing protein [Fererhizobium litorale]MDI7865298.1 CHAT domain-containing protein [Fererhizobium litorale]
MLASEVLAPLPENIPLKAVTGTWQFIPVPLPEQNITHLALSGKEDRLFLGTRDGVAAYDGVTVRVPEFSPSQTAQSLIVNSMVEVDDGAVIVGTANDSLWRWKDDKLSPLYGACPRGTEGCPTGDWALARSHAGTLYVVSSHYTLRQTEALAALRSAVKETVVPVATSASFLGFSGENLVAVSQIGDVSIIDKTSGEPTIVTQFDVGPGAFVRTVSFAPDTVLAGTDAKCIAVPLDPAKSSTEFAAGNCTATYRQADGTAWLSTNALYRNEGYDWAEWSPGSVGSISANGVLEDGMSNVWVASTSGLWRYLDLSREYRFPAPDDGIASLLADNAGGVFVGMMSGKVWQVDRRLHATPLLAAAASLKPQSAYYRGALLASAGNGALWSLSADGLFRIEKGTVTKIADYPLPMTEGPRAVASFAISSAGQICAGLNWSTEVLCLREGKWETTLETLPYFGGSTVGAVGFDDQGALMAVGPVSVSIKARGDVTLTLGPFKPSPFGRVNGFGAITTLNNVTGAEAVVSGGWGRTIFLKKTNGAWSAIERRVSDSQEQPYLIRSFAVHPRFGLMASTDAGVYRWEGTADSGQWRSLRDIDPRLGSWVEHIVAGAGNTFWIASGSSLTRITFPVTEPTINISGPPESGMIDHSAIAYDLRFPGLVGLPDRKIATVTYDPPIPNAVGHVTGPTARIDLTELNDLQSYRVQSVVTDGFLNVGKPVVSKFLVRLPFYQNPYKLTLALGALVALLALLVTRRGPTGFFLRRIGGLRWSTEKADPQLSLEIDEISEATIRFELETPAAINLIKLTVDVSRAQVEGLPKQALPFLVSTAEGATSLEREEFDSALQRVSEVLYDEALPESVRFTTSQLETGAMSLDLSKSLLWFPLELASDGHDNPLLLRYAIGRTVSGDKLADADGLKASRLKVAIVAPQLEPGQEQLLHVKAEAEVVASTVRAWGAEIIPVDPGASKKEVVDALCNSHLFHYAGHAEFDRLDAGQSFLPLLNDRLTADEVAEALATRPNDLLLAFINGCGTSREASWERADDVYGFASAFLNNASFFVGSQWPIQDEFAAPFAAAFYKELFPTSYGLWWRLIRRNELSGLPFAESLRRARHVLREMSYTSDQTWSSYVFYGDPTRRLVLA